MGVRLHELAYTLLNAYFLRHLSNTSNDSTALLPDVNTLVFVIIVLVRSISISHEKF